MPVNLGCAAGNNPNNSGTMRRVRPLLIPAYHIRIPFSTTALSLALYHYKVIGDSGAIGHGKLTIVR